MADKSIEQLAAAASVQSSDLFVLQQNGTAKKLTGQILENWLVAMADGHGGIQSIAKQSSSGLKDTYRITLADTTAFDFTVTNGKGVSSLSKTGTAGLADTYRMTYTDGTYATFTVTNGAKGDKGDQTYVHIKWSTVANPGNTDMGDIPADYIGIYTGTAATAPASAALYKWYRYKGEKGSKGDNAEVTGNSVAYQACESGTVPPTGFWSDTVPEVPNGQFLWTRTRITFNTGDPIVSYCVGRYGIDGTGAVSTVNGLSPDAAGNILLAASGIGTEDGSTVQQLLTDLKGTAEGAIPNAPSSVSGTNLAANAVTAGKIAPGAVSDTYTAVIGTDWSGTEAPFTQTVAVAGMTAGDTPIVDLIPSGTFAEAESQIENWAKIYRMTTGTNKVTVYAMEKTSLGLTVQMKCVRR